MNHDIRDVSGGYDVSASFINARSSADAEVINAPGSVIFSESNSGSVVPASSDDRVPGHPPQHEDGANLDNEADFQMDSVTFQANLMERMSLSEFLDENTSDDDATAHRRYEELDLRCYQKELAEEALKGSNVIICSQTGSGKTLIAVHIVEQHFAQNRGDSTRKLRAAYLVTTQNLVQQQCAKFIKHTRLQCIGISGGDLKQSRLRHLLNQYQMFVMTPMILLNGLKEQEEAERVNLFEHFSLLLFDECHHCTRDDPYNQIMQQHYFNPANSHLPKPQIVGLTASPGVGKADKVKEAVDHILQLCAALDVKKFCVVRRNSEELQQYIRLPASLTIACASRSDQNKFGKNLKLFMRALSNRLTRTLVENKDLILQGSDITVEDYKKMLPPPSEDYGTPTFSTYIGSARAVVHKVLHEAVKRFLVVLFDNLHVFNNAFTLSQMVRSVDAHAYINRKFSDNLFVTERQLQEDAGADTGTLSFLKQEADILRFRNELLMTVGDVDAEQSKLKNAKPDWPPFETDVDQKDGLVECSRPMLLRLRYEICRLFKWEMNGDLRSSAAQRRDSRVLVFVRERCIGKALKQFCYDDKYLKQLDAEFLSGANAPSVAGGLTQNLQNQIITAFRDGTHKIIISTSVAEEGLDISECNLVVRYCYATNEIAKVQSRGRARAPNSREILIVDSNVPWLKKKERVNEARIKIMEEAIDLVVKCIELSNDDYVRRINLWQKKLNAEMQSKQLCKSAGPNGHEIAWPDSEWLLLCRKCSMLICSSDNVKQFGSQIIVVDSEIIDRVYYVAAVPQGKKVYCKQCDEPLGVVVPIRSMEFVLPTVTCVTFRSNDSSKGVKAWKFAPFKPAEVGLGVLLALKYGPLRSYEEHLSATRPELGQTQT